MEIACGNAMLEKILKDYENEIEGFQIRCRDIEEAGEKYKS